MIPQQSGQPRPLRVLLITRAPVGGLWRHMLDLMDGLLDRGFELGIIVDSLRASSFVHETLSRYEPRLILGVHKFRIPRTPGVSDISLALSCRKLIKQLDPDIVHGHSAKGGMYARLAAWGLDCQSIYTPHGGSLHYQWRTPRGALYLLGERLLAPLCDQFLFESEFSKREFRRKLFATGERSRVIFNGLRENEFVAGPTQIDDPEFDFAFVGEMRPIKGVDIFLKAAAKVKDLDGRPARLLLLGDGPSFDAYKELAVSLGIEAHARFVGRKPVKEAFAATNTVVVPSRAESLPYIVMEAIAAGKNVIATDVGGINEIFGPTREALIPAGEVEALATAMRTAMQPATERQLQDRQARFDFVAKNFHVETMVDQVAETYRSLVLGPAQQCTPVTRTGSRSHT